MTVKISKLKNGLRVATDTMMDAESVVTGLWVGAGTRDEPWGANGIAHLVEHMMFKGTKTRSAYTLSATIEKNGGSMNAYTTREETAYYARVLPEHVASALEILADMIQRSSFQNKELKRERQVILQEIGRDLDSPEDHIFDLTYQKAFPKQRFGRPILGSPQIIATMPRSAVAAYVKHHYHAGSMVLVAAGKVDHEKFVALAEKHFGSLSQEKAKPREKAKVKAGAQYVAKDIEQLHLVLGFSACNLYDNTLEATQILSILLGGSASSRLFQNIREKRGLVYTISSALSPYSDVGLFQIYAGTDPKRVNELIPAVCHELKDVTHRIGAAELKRAKAQWRADILMGQESVMRRADNLGHQILKFGHAKDLATVLKKIERVQDNDVKAVAKKLIQKAPIVAALGPLEKMETYRNVVGRLAV